MESSNFSARGTHRRSFALRPPPHFAIPPEASAEARPEPRRGVSFVRPAPTPEPEAGKAARRGSPRVPLTSAVSPELRRLIFSATAGESGMERRARRSGR